MLVPGGNILMMALRVIQPQAPLLKQWTGRSTNAAGRQVSTYADPVAIIGSFQPIDRKHYQQLGLDLNKSHSMLYTPVPISTPGRDRSGDQLIYGGKLHEAQSETDWSTQDGWAGYTFVEIGPAV